MAQKLDFKKLLTKGNNFGDLGKIVYFCSCLWSILLLFLNLAVEKQLKPLREKLGNDWNISYKWGEILREVEPERVLMVPTAYLGGGVPKNFVEGICNRWDEGMVEALKEVVPGKRLVFTCGKDPQDWAQYSSFSVAFKIEDGNLLIIFNSELAKVHGFGAECLEWWIKKTF
jgi:hypothetical protein